MGNECHACENVKDQQNRFQKFEKVGRLATPQPNGQHADSSTLGTAENLPDKNTYFKKEEIAEHSLEVGIGSNAEAVHFRSGATYEGEWQDSVRHGHGKMVWPDGATYVGDWVKDKAEGKGLFTHPSGDTYEG